MQGHVTELQNGMSVLVPRSTVERLRLGTWVARREDLEVFYAMRRDC